MAMLVTDPCVEERLKQEREASGADRYDEVWEGVYMMAPIPNNEHQRLVLALSAMLYDVVVRPNLGDAGQVNLSNLADNWERDYRVPDLAVFLFESRAQDLGAHWQGPADFLIEITSPGDQTREKIPYYERLGVRELLIIDRDPWALELYRHQGGQLEKVGESTPQSTSTLASEVLSLAFRLVPGEPRPKVEVRETSTGRVWLA